MKHPYVRILYIEALWKVGKIRTGGGHASSSIHLSAVASDRIPTGRQILAWLTAKDPPSGVFNRSCSVVEQHHHVPVLFMSNRENSSGVALTPSLDSSTSLGDVAMVMIGIDASSENA